MARGEVGNDCLTEATQVGWGTFFKPQVGTIKTGLTTSGLTAITPIIYILTNLYNRIK